MATDIELRNNNGNVTRFNGVNHIKVAGYGNNGEPEEQVFSHMTGLNLYYYQPLGDAIKIIKKVIPWASNDVWFTGFSENDMNTHGYDNNGTLAISLMICRNPNLVAGQTYTESVLY